MMGGFGSGHWIDVMTRKVNTGLCRSLSVKRLKKMGVFDANLQQDRFLIQWINELGGWEKCHASFSAQPASRRVPCPPSPTARRSAPLTHSIPHRG